MKQKMHGGQAHRLEHPVRFAAHKRDWKAGLVLATAHANQTPWGGPVAIAQKTTQDI